MTGSQKRPAIDLAPPPSSLVVMIDGVPFLPDAARALNMFKNDQRRAIVGKMRRIQLHATMDQTDHIEEIEELLNAELLVTEVARVGTLRVFYTRKGTSILVLAFKQTPPGSHLPGFKVLAREVIHVSPGSGPRGTTRHLLHWHTGRFRRHALQLDPSHQRIDIRALLTRATKGNRQCLATERKSNRATPSSLPARSMAAPAPAPKPPRDRPALPAVLTGLVQSGARRHTSFHRASAARRGLVMS